MKKGFTLIELLAVIVILAIIALIAVPIIINIINDSRESSNKRSVELYGTAVQNAIAKSQLNGTEIPSGDLSSDFLSTVDYSGSRVECTTNKLYEDGKIYLAGCKVNNNGDYTYGIEQTAGTEEASTPRYYSWSSYASISDGLPDDKNQDLTQIDTNGHPFYLAFDSEDGETIDAAYVCFKRNDIEYCLKGYDTSAYASNQSIIREAFSDVADDEDCCSFDDDDSRCSTDGLNAYATSYGYVFAGDGSAGCNVNGYGSFECAEY